MTPRALLILVAALGLGVVAGVFFAFSSFVMPALARLPPAQGAAAMQSINIAAINRCFMTVLFGTGTLALALCVASLRMRGVSGSGWLLAGTTTYLLGALAVTIAANVPRNEALALLAPGTGASNAYWPQYLAEWCGWNHVRTVAAIVATACFLCARG